MYSVDFYTVDELGDFYKFSVLLSANSSIGSTALSNRYDAILALLKRRRPSFACGYNDASILSGSGECHITRYGSSCHPSN
jgi:hypothetical protein